MSETLLLEVGLEELPAQYVRSSADQLSERVQKFLTEQALSFGTVEVFATPRRLAVRVADVAERQEDRTEIFKGPSLAVAQKDGIWTKAAEGFVRGKGLTVEDIYVEDDYIHVKKQFVGQEATTVLGGLSDVITAMTFPVTMRWADHTFEYLRPIHWIVALFGSAVIEDVHVLDVQAGRTTRGHRFLGKDVEVSSPADYEKVLAEQFVIVSQDERKALIKDQMKALEAKNQWYILEDEELLEEVSAILEYPTVFAGTFDEKYLVVPEPVLVTSMKEHQRYFVVYNDKNELLPYFISARNGDNYMIENVAKGNQKVLTARLEDALFFYNEDKKLIIDACLQKLATLNFHAKIGSMTEKMARVYLLVEELGGILALDQEVLQAAKRAAQIYKFDLVTNMVGEFPELQGIMGEIYALEQGETPAVAQAIREHYMPVAADAELPSSQAGALLALADKIDSFLSFMAIGLVPTGSNDPYALRRQLMGAIQIVDAFGWKLPLETALHDLLDSHYITLVKEAVETKEVVRTFLRDRLAKKLQEVTTRHDIIDAVLSSQIQAISTLTEVAKVLTKRASESNFKETVEALTRVLNISHKQEVVGTIDITLFETESEKTLYQEVIKLEERYPSLTIAEKYDALAQLTPFITEFFNENMIMVDNSAVRQNRVNLLAKIGALTDQVAHFPTLIAKK